MTDKGIDRDKLIAFARGKLSREESEHVLAAIEADEALSRELEEILQLIRATEELEDEKKNADGRLTIGEPILKYILRIAAVLVVLLGASVLASELTKGRYHDLARVDRVDFGVRWRGDAEEQIEWARREFVGGDRDAAIRELERIVQLRPAGESMSVVHLMAGQMLLTTAEESVCGLFPRYDRQRVTRGMDHLAFAAQSTNNRVAEEAHWFRLKGFLMLDKPEEAKKEGEEVMRRHGEYENQTVILLDEIHNQRL